MTIIAPSILACDFLNISSEVNALKNIPNLWLHLDIMDGHFVPNLTFGIPIVKMISSYTDIKLDAHLMVTNPHFHIEQMKDFGIHNITFHLESVENSLALILEAKKHYPSVGISIKPNTEVESISIDILRNIDLLLVMSVEPGFGGQSFIENTYSKLKEINKLKEEQNLKFQIQVDGGVKDTNSQKLIQAGADNLVAGSFIFKNEARNYKDKIELLRSN